ncbi:hypothetical protein G6O67_000887 [Ophiocordyceps sinensis]|uniref:Uncharacterized protein n=1 Tax=Ophiocordyceps sinensis TaxID=72228 RepID=A0A8H4PZY0_9HYPO|nr:hypothetical protein G6O67_000887 [Ophiocordyceps sinensis]
MDLDLDGFAMATQKVFDSGRLYFDRQGEYAVSDTIPPDWVSRPGRSSLSSTPTLPTGTRLQYPSRPNATASSKIKNVSRHTTHFLTSHNLLCHPKPTFYPIFFFRPTPDVAQHVGIPEAGSFPADLAV